MPSKGTVMYEGATADVLAAARAYRGAGYFVTEEAKVGAVVIAHVTSADGDFQLTLRSWTGDAPAYLPVNDAGVLDRPRTNGEIRTWYKAQISRVAALDDGWFAAGVSLAERARRAYEVRRHARLAAREQMLVSGEVAGLAVRDLAEYGDADGPTFEQLVDTHLTAGLTRDQAYEAIIGSSRRSNARYDRKHEAKDPER